MIFTSSFFSPELHIGETISISRSDPKKVKGLHIADRLPIFAPSKALLRWWKDIGEKQDDWENYWRRYYREIKENDEGIRKWVNSLDPDQDYTLCCWEKTDERCHRSLVGKIIQKIDEEAFGGEILPDDAPMPEPPKKEAIAPEVQPSDNLLKLKPGDKVYWVDRPTYLGFLDFAITVRSINDDGTFNCSNVGNPIARHRLRHQRDLDREKNSPTPENLPNNKG